MFGRFKFLLVSSVAVSLAVLATPGVASAYNDPYGIPLPPSSESYAAGTASDFQLDFTTIKSNEYARITTAPDGTVTATVTGSGVVQFTNDRTGKSITLKLSGPLAVVVPPTGTDFAVVVPGVLVGVGIPAPM